MNNTNSFNLKNLILCITALAMLPMHAGSVAKYFGKNIYNAMPPGIQIDQKASDKFSTRITPPVNNTVLTVGPDKQFQKIQDAIDSLGENAGFTTIKIDPGLYDEYLYLEGIQAGANIQPTLFGSPLANVAQGLQIIGDDRLFGPGKSYVNGYENAGDSLAGSSLPFPYPHAYFPALGTNFAITRLIPSEPVDDTQRITVLMTDPLPIQDRFRSQVTGCNGDYIMLPSVIEQPIFDSEFVGLKAGDMFILADNEILTPDGHPGSYITSVHVITQIIDGNTLEFTPRIPENLDITKEGSSLTFLPNVIVSPSQPLPVPNFSIMTVNNASFSMSGIRFDLAEGNVLGSGLLLGGSNSILSNIVCTDRLKSSTDAAFRLVDSNVLINNSQSFALPTDRQNFLASVGWQVGFLMQSSTIANGHVFVANSSQAIGIGGGSTMTLNSIEIHGANVMLKPGGDAGLSLGVTSAFGARNSVYVNDILAVTDCWGNGIFVDSGSNVYMHNPAMRIERVYNTGQPQCTAGGIVVSQGADFSIYLGYTQENGQPQSTIRDTSVYKDLYNILPNGTECILRTLPQVGIYLYEGARFTTEGKMQFENVDVPYMVRKDGILSAAYDDASPQNVFQHQVSEPLDIAFFNQAMHPSAKKITLDPARICPCGGTAEFYTSKTFTLFSTDDSEHFLTIPSSARFIGSLGSDGHTIKFLSKQKVNECCDKKRRRCETVTGAYITFTVLDTNTVLIKDHFGVEIQD